MKPSVPGCNASDPAPPPQKDASNHTVRILFRKERTKIADFHLKDLTKTFHTWRIFFKVKNETSHLRGNGRMCFLSVRYLRSEFLLLLCGRDSQRPSAERTRGALGFFPTWLGRAEEEVGRRSKTDCAMRALNPA